MDIFLVAKRWGLSLTFMALSLSLSLQGAFAADYPKVVTQAITEACKYYDEGKFASARSQFNEALREEPNCPAI
jgi:Tfp pilus assembly protein PilF